MGDPTGFGIGYVENCPPGPWSFGRTKDSIRNGPGVGRGKALAPGQPYHSVLDKIL